MEDSLRRRVLGYKTKSPEPFFPSIPDAPFPHLPLQMIPALEFTSNQLFPFESSPFQNLVSFLYSCKSAFMSLTLQTCSFLAPQPHAAKYHSAHQKLRFLAHAEHPNHGMAHHPNMSDIRHLEPTKPTRFFPIRSLITAQTSFSGFLTSSYASSQFCQRVVKSQGVFSSIRLRLSSIAIFTRHLAEEVLYPTVCT